MFKKTYYFWPYSNWLIFWFKKINGLYVHIKKALVLLLLQCTVHAPYRYEFREDDESTDFPSTSWNWRGLLKGTVSRDCGDLWLISEDRSEVFRFFPLYIFYIVVLLNKKIKKSWRSLGCCFRYYQRRVKYSSPGQFMQLQYLCLVYVSSIFRPILSIFLSLSISLHPSCLELNRSKKSPV